MQGLHVCGRATLSLTKPSVLFPELNRANDLAIVASAAFVIVVVPAMLGAAGFAVFAFFYPAAKPDRE
jgi:hypothetical protein